MTGVASSLPRGGCHLQRGLEHAAALGGRGKVFLMMCPMQLPVYRLELKAGVASTLVQVIPLMSVLTLHFDKAKLEGLSGG